MKINPENTCQPALDELLSRMENEHLDTAGLDTLCRQFPDCADSLRSSYAMWQLMGELEQIPEPHPSMDTSFYKMLNDFQAGEHRKTRSIFNWNWLNWNTSTFRWGMMAGVFALGIFVGTFFQATPGDPVLAEAAEEEYPKTDKHYAKLTASSSASDRLEGIQLVKRMDRLDDRIIEALNQTLLHDSNVNVRLSALETMLHFADNPKVRENLIRAIPFQTSPLVQMTLAEVMIALKDKRAIREIRELLERQQLEVEVQMMMEETIETLS